MAKAQLVFVPSPGIGHLVSNIEFAKRLLDRDDGFSITFLVIIPPFAPNLESYVQSAAQSDTRIRYIVLPQVPPTTSIDPTKSPEAYITNFIDGHKSLVKHAIITNVLSNTSLPVSGLVVDSFCTSMIDVAHELGIPSYIFYTSGVAFLALMLSLPDRYDKVGSEFKVTDPDTVFPGYEYPLPASILPSFLFEKDGFMCFQRHARRFKETEGIIVNSFVELEPYAVKSVAAIDEVPPIFTVGSILNFKGQQDPTKASVNRSQNDEIFKWLDDQPQQSVVFLCFGSVGSLNEQQIKEVALGLEQSGQRFLWSLRKNLQRKFGYPDEVDSFEEILPEGFLEKTKNRGRLCGWAPQVQVLAHKSVGGFVSHCGWNSILESLWYGVPIVTWPMYAEQQPNAFLMVKELKLAVEMKLVYKMHTTDIVFANEIADSVRCVMEGDTEVRKKVKRMQEVSRKTVTKGWSSFEAFGRLIELFLANAVDSNGF